MITISLHATRKFHVASTALKSARCHTVDLKTSDSGSATDVILFVGVENADKIREYAEALLAAAAEYLPVPGSIIDVEFDIVPPQGRPPTYAV